MKNLKAQKWVLKSIRKDIFIVLLLAVLSSIIALCTVWFALISGGGVDIGTGPARGDFWNESGKAYRYFAASGLFRYCQQPS